MNLLFLTQKRHSSNKGVEQANATCPLVDTYRVDTVLNLSNFPSRILCFSSSILFEYENPEFRAKTKTLPHRPTVFMVKYLHCNISTTSKYFETIVAY
jgi:hypothetical protein